MGSIKPSTQTINVYTKNNEQQWTKKLKHQSQGF